MTLAHQPPQIAHVNGIDICYEIFGDAAAEPLLLIMGLGAQMIHWDDDFCRQLAARGFRVIRFDNRDIGKSSRMTGGKRLGPVELLKLRFLKIPVAAPYKLIDMARAAPVAVTKYERPVVVVLAVEEFERLKALDAPASTK